MPKKRITRKIKKKHKQPKIAWRGIIAVFLVGIIYLLVNVFSSQTKPVNETREGEMKHLPNSIKRELTKTPVNATFRVPILIYHYVEYVKDTNDTIRQSLNIAPSVFEEQIKTLKEAGYKFMTAAQLGEVLKGRRKLPDKPILITIDDGHWDVETDVLPILAKYNASATAYVVPGFTGGSDSMTQKQIKKVVKSGLVEIGAHTVHHLSLRGILAPVVYYEVVESKKVLEKTYGIKVVSFAYPNGDFDAQAAKIVKEAGYTTAVSTIPGIEQSDANQYFLYRLRPGRRTGQSLLEWLNQKTFTAY